MKKVIWCGEHTCNICNKECDTHLYDARIKGHSAWATMCKECFEMYGVGLGVGNGQEYIKDEETNKFFSR